MKRVNGCVSVSGRQSPSATLLSGVLQFNGSSGQRLGSDAPLRLVEIADIMICREAIMRHVVMLESRASDRIATSLTLEDLPGGAWVANN